MTLARHGVLGLAVHSGACFTQACDAQTPDAGQNRPVRHDACPTARPCPGPGLDAWSWVPAWPDACCPTDDPPLAYHGSTRHDRPPDVEHAVRARRPGAVPAC